MRSVVVAVLVACAAGCATPEQGGRVRVAIHENATTYSLANGLEVILIQDHRTPFVAVRLRYHAGSKDDPAGREGLAHLYEHMMFGGSRHVARDDVLPSLERLGARAYNGTTTRDDTDYYETVPSGALEAALWIEADRMRSAADVFDDKLLAREQDVVENERRLTVENVPLGNVPAIIADAMYPASHPYKHLPLGTTPTVRGVTLDDVRGFHERHYTPDDATLALVGDFEPSRARAMIEKYFGPAAPAKTAVAPRRIATVTSAATKRVRVDANVSYGGVRVVWPLPARGQPGFYESWGALVLATWTVDSRSAQQKIAHAVTSRFDPYRLGTLGEIRGELDPGASPEAFVEVVSSVVSSLGNARRLTYLPDLRSELIGDDLYAQEWVGDRASRAQFYDEGYGDPDHVMTELRTIQGMSSANVTAAYSSLLSMDHALVAVIVPDPQAPLAGRREP